MAQTKSTKKKSDSLKPATARRNTKSEPKGKAAKTVNRTPRIIWGVVFLILSALIFVSYFFNEGSLIVYFSEFVKGIIGYGYWAIGVCFFFNFIILCFGTDDKFGFRIFCALTFPIFFAAVLHLIQYGPDTTIHFKDYFLSGSNLLSGGVVGSLIAFYVFKLLSKVGGAIILFIILIIELLIILGANADTFKFEEKEYKNDAAYNKPKYEPAKAVSVKSPSKVQQTISIDDLPPIVSKAAKTASSTSIKNKYDVPLGGKDDVTLNVLGKSSAKSSKTGKKAASKVPITTFDNVEKEFGSDLSKENKKPEKIKKADIVKASDDVADEIAFSASSAVGTYIYPKTDLLNYGSDRGSDSKDEILATKERLESTLHSFGINSYVVNITPGPTVTRYDIELEQGVKLTKVTNLSGDVALALGVLNVRIAPIPDEISTVGIEVPNKIVNTVSLREIIESDNFQNAKSKLTFAIGKDIGGHAIVGNISKLPHMLIAGTTGSGKSVCMNSLIVSLLYKARPDEVKFIMIDPKMVELGVYNSIPHLYVPVVTEPKKAAGALQWAVVEMLKRYRLFSDAGVRDLESYNSFCKQNEDQPLPQVVIVIDELADLMMAASKEVEESICRVAQMGRAAGMHLIIATQRPSADVITGLMKANIPSRIAFAVSSAMESRIIMDTAGAEKLVGMGDMLYSPIGSGKPLRVQGSFISDFEREKVINFIKENCDIKAEKNTDLEQAMNAVSDKDSQIGSNDDDKSSVSGDYDQVLPEAVEIVLEMKSCSVSMLQRRLKLGYSRAARVVDQMEELGIVGPYEGAKPRSVQVDRDAWNQIQIELGFASENDFAIADEMNDSFDALNGIDEDELPEDELY